MEENQDRIAQWARNSGLTEDEARIYYHLSEAAELYAALPANYDKDIIEWMSYYKPMVRMLMWRVVKRDHSDGWVTDQEWEERELAAEGEADEPLP